MAVKGIKAGRADRQMAVCLLPVRHQQTRTASGARLFQRLQKHFSLRRREIHIKAPLSGHDAVDPAPASNAVFDLRPGHVMHPPEERTHGEARLRDAQHMQAHLRHQHRADQLHHKGEYHQPRIAAPGRAQGHQRHDPLQHRTEDCHPPRLPEAHLLPRLLRKAAAQQAEEAPQGQQRRQGIGHIDQHPVSLLPTRLRSQQLLPHSR